MAKLKLGAIEDEKPVKLTIKLSAAVHRDLIAYGELLGREGSQPAIQPAKLAGPMLARFMATDRIFVKKRRPTSPMPEESHASVSSNKPN